MVQRRRKLVRQAGKVAYSNDYSAFSMGERARGDEWGCSAKWMVGAIGQTRAIGWLDDAKGEAHSAKQVPSPISKSVRKR